MNKGISILIILLVVIVIGGVLIWQYSGAPQGEIGPPERETPEEIVKEEHSCGNDICDQAAVTLWENQKFRFSNREVMAVDFSITKSADVLVGLPNALESYPSCLLNGLCEMNEGIKEETSFELLGINLYITRIVRTGDEATTYLLTTLSETTENCPKDCE